jgi:hypothetical protein
VRCANCHRRRTRGTAWAGESAHGRHHVGGPP